MIKKESPIEKKLTKAQIEQALIDNFINLQKVLTNLSIKFDDLSKNLSKLLQLFEISAKSFAEKYPDIDVSSKSDKELLEKLDSLLGQNKTIAQGIMLMEERIRQKTQEPNSVQKFSLPDSRYSSKLSQKPSNSGF
jgi:hypothetical protein